MLALLASSQAFIAASGRASGRSRALVCAELPQLEADAQALLDEAGGDAEKARANYIGYTMAYMEDAQPELFAALKSDPTREVRVRARARARARAVSYTHLTLPTTPYV